MSDVTAFHPSGFVKTERSLINLTVRPGAYRKTGAAPTARVKRIY
jgi:hypothetical protein